MSEPNESEPTEAIAEAPPLEGRELVDSIAAEMGWRPKDKWTGDPEKWRDSADYLKATPAVLKSTKEQMDRTARAAAQTIEKAQRKAIADAERRIAEAAEAGDTEAAIEATRDLREVSAPRDPLVVRFAEKNPWYTTHRAATNLAIEVAEEAMQNGKSVEEYLDAAEKEVKRRYPELFPGYKSDEPDPKDTGLQRGAPAVHGGQRAASPAPRKRGWNDMPKAVQDAQERHFVRKGLLSKEEAAEAYWSENAQ